MWNRIYLLGLGLIFLTGNVTWADDGRLYLIQPIAGDKSTYVLSKQGDAMKFGFELALKDFKIKFPKLECKPDITVNMDIRSDSDLYDEVKRLSKVPGRKAVVGLTRSDFARLAASAAIGSDTIGISAGAISNELQSINPNFISVGTAYQHHWKATAAGLKTLNCTPDNTLGIFAFKYVWSGYYKKSFLEEGYKRVVDVDKFLSVPNVPANVRCIFLGLTSPASVKPLSKLLAMKWPGAIIGTHDWVYFSAEIRALLADYKQRASRIYSVINWSRNENDQSRSWANKYFGGVTIVEPIHASIYDATIIALNYLCRGQNVLEFNADRWKHFGTLRTYQGMSASGNLETAIKFVELPIIEWNN